MPAQDAVVVPVPDCGLRPSSGLHEPEGVARMQCSGIRERDGVARMQRSGIRGGAHRGAMPAQDAVAAPVPDCGLRPPSGLRERDYASGMV